jgi:putative phosphoesterase
MRVALISDLHGNTLALEAVLADIARRGVDQLVCLGDVATLGPRPREVLGRLRDLGCVCILGNHDEFLLDAQLIHTYTEAPFIVEAVDWCRAELDEGELAFVRGFLPTHEIPLGGGATLLLFHGSPRSHMDDLLATTPHETLESLLGARRATVMAGGHTHVQMLRQHRGALLLNPGSLGMPFREYVNGGAPTILPHAEYATVEAHGGEAAVTLHRVPLDRRALHAATLDSRNPMAKLLAEQYA